MKKINHRNIICILICAFSIFLACTTYASSFTRLADNATNLGIELMNVVASFSDSELTESTIGDIPEYSSHRSDAEPTPTEPTTPTAPALPETAEEFSAKMEEYGALLTDSSNIASYLVLVMQLLFFITYYIMLLLPILLILKLIIKRLILRENNKYNKDTKPLIAFKWLELKVKKILIYLASIWEFGKTFYIYILMIVWAFSLNVPTIMIGMISYYLHLMASMSFDTLYMQFLRLVVDLTPFTTISPIILIPIALAIFDAIRKSIGYKALENYEEHNKEIIRGQDLAVFTEGTMGKGKTMLNTSQAVSNEVLFKETCREFIFEKFSRFPNFPFINLELAIQEEIKAHRIFNEVTVFEYIESIRAAFDADPCSANLYGYVIDRYPMTFDDGVSLEDIFKMISDYTKLYFIYTIAHSLVMSNYAIRSDNTIDTIGNFPIYRVDFFRKNAKESMEDSEYSKVLDFDVLRLGTLKLNNNPNADMLEFGIINITEGGKERGNMLDHRGMSPSDETANPLNDMLNLRIKMARHLCTIMNHPFFKIRLDDQRAESLGKDARELCIIQNIEKKGDIKLTIPFYFVEELIHDSIYPKFVNFAEEYRYNRGDNTLLFHIVKNVCSLIHAYNTRIRNTFGYYPLHLNVDGERQKYYILTKKDYCRYSTDCYSEIFGDKVKRSKKGWTDMPSYQGLKPTIGEMASQNSYVVEQMHDVTKEKEFDIDAYVRENSEII